MLTIANVFWANTIVEGLAAAACLTNNMIPDAKKNPSLNRWGQALGCALGSIGLMTYLAQGTGGAPEETQRVVGLSALFFHTAVDVSIIRRMVLENGSFAAAPFVVHGALALAFAKLFVF